MIRALLRPLCWLRGFHRLEPVLIQGHTPQHAGHRCADCGAYREDLGTVTLSRPSADRFLEPKVRQDVVDRITGKERDRVAPFGRRAR